MKTLEGKTDNGSSIFLELDESSLFLKVTMIDGRDESVMTMLLSPSMTLQIWMFLDKVVRR